MAFELVFLPSTYKVFCMGQFLSHSWLFYHKGVDFPQCNNNSVQIASLFIVTQILLEHQALKGS